MTLTDTTASRHELPPVREDGFWDGVAHSYIPPAQLTIDPSLKLHQTTATEIDPVTYEVVRYSLMNINLEHSDLVQRLCVSPITMLTRDFQVSLMTELGDLVFLGPNLQYFSNSHSLSVKYMLENRSAEPGINPGDMLISNDVYVGAPHQPDTCLAAPVFVGDELFCWVANTMHLSDVGGSMPGSFCIDAVDAFQEPLNWPPVKLVEGGKLRTEIEQLFVRQSREPKAVQMDLRAAIGANEATRAKVLKLVERYGADVVKGVMNGTLDAAERVFAERLEAIPDGTWSHRLYTEAALPGDREIYQYQVNLTKRDGHLIVDNAGTDPQAGAINITFAAFAGAMLAALTQMMISDLAGAYGGAYRLVEFRPVPGLLNCCDYPGAVSPSGALTTEMQINASAIVVSKMLASGDAASAELVLGTTIPHFYGPISAGVTRGGDEFIFPCTNGMAGAIGGRPTRDGIDSGGHWWIPDGIAYNCEDVEAQYPLLVVYRRLLDAGLDGSGRNRGGLGFRECWAAFNAEVVQVLLHEGDAFVKGAGLFGAAPGSLSTIKVKHNTDLLEVLAGGVVPKTIEEIGGEVEVCQFKGPPFALTEGETFEWVSPSTSGYGDPLRREPAAVLADLVDGYLDVAAAERVYGVVVVDGAVDEDATAAARLAVRRARLGGDAEPADLVAAPAGAQRIGELLHVVDGRWWCNGADLGPSNGNYREAAIRREVLAREIGPEYDAADHEMADRVVYREFVCPVTGYLIDTEISKADQPPLHDIVIDA